MTIIIPLKWLPIPSYENLYQINELGTIKSMERHVPHKNSSLYCRKKYLKTRINNCGYREVRLNKNGGTKTYLLHRLLALTFLPYAPSKMEVNHKDGKKTNNSLSNLEWVSHRENVVHAYKTGLFKVFDKTRKKVIDTCSGKEFESARKAAHYYKIPYSSCKNYLNGNRHNPTCLRYLVN